jgi:hypothetical protein
VTPSRTAAARSTHRSASGSRRSTVRHPRRISGPAQAASAGRISAATAAIALPAPGIALPARRSANKTARRSVQGAPGIALRAVDAFEGLSSSAVLDKLIRGRAWIGLLAFALIGIVTMQLLVLKLNTGIGRTLGHVAQLQRENAQLGIEDSTYSAESRVAPLAGASGMTLAPAGTMHFVASSKADIAHAAAALSAAVQSSASGVLGSSEGGSSESESSTTTSSEASSSAATQQSSTSTIETPSSSEANSSSEGASKSSEASSTVGSGQGSPASGSSPPATPASPEAGSPSGAGAEATGASSAPSGGSASGTETGGSGGVTQAGSRE